ncbi:MAG: hypothetical protein EYC68_16315 [Chloroflexota bacterium]|nr:MAG: hypothetical protein EYC68_16315 [Chloroflexota bacterium]
MNPYTAIPLLEQEWELESGFLGKLRDGNFDSAALERLMRLLESINVDHAVTLERRFVSLTWLIPIYITWQRERVQEKMGDVSSLDRAADRLQTVLDKILGIP